jgi:glycosyltransferase involved in cell wall biosynthesis
LKTKKALLIYIEPTPYILGLVTQLNQLWPGGVDVLFIGENASQAWSLTLDRQYMTVLPIGWKASMREIGMRLASGDYEIVHLAGWAPLIMLTTMLIARIRSIPITMETDTPLPQELPIWKRAVKMMIYPVLFKLPAKFMPGGKRQAAYLKHYGVPDNRIVQTQMTVDISAISLYISGIDEVRRGEIRSDFGIPKEATVFLYVGRMEPHKGLHELVEAFVSLSAVGSEPMALLLVGEGSMRGMLEKAAAADSRIRLTGRLSGTALLDAYAAADVFVLASRFEPWGLVINEAMAAGLPVIATDRVGCVDDLVVEGKTGHVVPAESVSALAAAMESLLRDRHMRGKMSRNARELIAGWTLEHEAGIVVDTWKCLQEH